MLDLNLPKDSVYKVFMMIYQNHYSNFEDDTLAKPRNPVLKPKEADTQVHFTYLKPNTKNKVTACSEAIQTEAQNHDPNINKAKEDKTLIKAMKDFKISPNKLIP